MPKQAINLFWFRRDLRLDDNKGLYAALNSGLPVLPVFIFDKHILDKLGDNSDSRVTFIHSQLERINSELRQLRSCLKTFYGYPEDVWPQILEAYDITAIFTNNDYEPYALKRDQEVRELCKNEKIDFNSFKDHVIFEPHEILKDDDSPYRVFTPYSKKWKGCLTAKHLESVPSAHYFSNFMPCDDIGVTTLNEMGFEQSNLEIPSDTVSNDLLQKYEGLRNYPAEAGTSKLGIHLRFGTISIRKLAQQSLEKSSIYLNELIWREFYQMILSHFPHVVERNFNKKYDVVEWRFDENEFAAWCEGRTGYPIVDAGMRELNTTGFMHNRVRMVVASFLTKHLMHDWQLGEAYFAEKLLDFELASNNGGWQWAAGTGTDAQPYFRIFNPESQTKKFDPNLSYIKKWVPEFQETSYPKPIVDHKFARERCLNRFKEALSE